MSMIRNKILQTIISPKTFCVLLVTAVAPLFALNAYALSIGEISVNSHIGEPLDISIAMSVDSQSELDSLKIELAPKAIFEQSGVPYPLEAGSIEFAIGNENDNPVVQITTFNALDTPYLHLLIQLSWPSGSMLREYIVLIDPVDYRKPVQTSAVSQESLDQTAEKAAVKAAEKVAAKAAEKAAVKAAEKVAAKAAEKVAAKAAEKAAAKVAKKAVAKKAVAKKAVAKVTNKTIVRTTTEPSLSAEWITVVAGDTVSSIAENYRPSDVSAQQAWVAIFNLNRDAFPTNNIDLLMKGARLKIPTREQMLALTQRNATSKARSLRPKAKVAKKSSDSANTAQQTAAKSAQQDVLTIGASNTKTDSSNDGINSAAAEELLESEFGDAVSIKEGISALREDLTAVKGENQAVANRLSQVEAQLSKINQLLEIQSQTLATLNDQTRLKAQAIETSAGQSLDKKTPDDETEIQSASATADPVVNNDGTDSVASITDKITELFRGGIDKLTQGSIGANLMALLSKWGLYILGGLLVLVGLGGFMRRRNENKNETQSSTNSNAGNEFESDIEGFTTTSDDDSINVEVSADDSAGIEASDGDSAGIEASDGDSAGIEASDGDSAGIEASDGDSAGIEASADGSIDIDLGDDQEYSAFSLNEDSIVQLDNEVSEDSIAQLDNEVSELPEGKREGDYSLSLADAQDSMMVAESEMLSQQSTAEQAMDATPIEEAEVYLAYDKKEQAIKVLEEAYSGNPNDQGIAIKLMSLYESANDQEAFSKVLETAHANKDASTDEEQWLEIKTMAKNFAPTHPLFIDNDSDSSDSVLHDDIEYQMEDDLTADSPSVDETKDNMEVAAVPTATAAGGGHDLSDDSQSSEIDFMEDDVDFVASELKLSDEELSLEDDLEMIVENDLLKLDADDELTSEATDAGLDDDSAAKETNQQDPKESLELAKSYIELGDENIAKGLLEDIIATDDNVLADDSALKAEASELLKNIKD